MTLAVRPRVVIADDSALMRRILATSLTKQGVDVVGVAKDGDEALAVCQSARPDAMTLDLMMPGLDGIGVLRRLRAGGESSVPVVVVSAFSEARGAGAVEALAEGAFDFVAKPSARGDLQGFTRDLLAKVVLAAASRSRLTAAASFGRPAASAPVRPRPRGHGARAILIATSTGGPRALAELLPRLPAPLGAGTLIVQHMPAGFTASLAGRLDRTSALTVREASGGERLDPRVALLAPGGSHLRIGAGGRTELSDGPALGGLRPRADLLIADAARAYGERLLLVVLTGMGNDGLAGAREVRRQGGRILAESEASCTVYGMPRAVVEAGLADAVMDLDQLATTIATEACS